MHSVYMDCFQMVSSQLLQQLPSMDNRPVSLLSNR